MSQAAGARPAIWFQTYRVAGLRRVKGVAGCFSVKPFPANAVRGLRLILVSMATSPPYDPGAENMADHLLRMVGDDFGAAIERSKKAASTYRQESSLFRSIGDMAAANEQAQTAF